jgi:hypothetical protein
LAVLREFWDKGIARKSRCFLAFQTSANYSKNILMEEKYMDGIKKFLREEPGTAEAASSAVMIGMASGLSGIWNGGFPGIWNSLTNNPLALVLVVATLGFMLWLVLKA